MGRAEASRRLRQIAAIATLLPLVACGTSVVGDSGKESSGDGGGTTASATISSSTASMATTSGAGGSDATGGGAGYPGCIAQDPSVVSELQFEIPFWNKPATNSLTLDTLCEVATHDRDGFTARLELSCDVEKVGVSTIAVTLNLPADIDLALPAGTPLQLRFYGHGRLTDRRAGKRFALHRPDDEALVLAGYDEEYHEALPDWSTSLGSLVATPDTTVCPRVCDGLPPGECGPTFEHSQRLGIAVAAGDSQVVVLDGHRGLLATQDTSFDVVVGAAKGGLSLTGQFDFRVLLVRRD